MDFPVLTVLALLPALGAVAVVLAGVRLAKQVALAAAVATAVVAAVVALRFTPGGGPQFTEQVTWIRPLGAYYALGVDGIGLTLVLLVVVVTPVVIVASWRDFDKVKMRAEPVEAALRQGTGASAGDHGTLRQASGSSAVDPGTVRQASGSSAVDPGTLRQASGSSAVDPGTVRQASGTLPPKYDSRVFFALVLAVETCALYLFLATDVFLFYVFFEVILIPMYFLIGGFGPGPRRTYAAAKFLIFGLLGGFVMLASVIGLYVQSGRSGGAQLPAQHAERPGLRHRTERWLFLGFMFAFAIKAPLVRLHTWLPDAAEESSPGGATMMVGVMDKIGTFGMIRFCLGLFPEASQWATPVVIVLAVISILYGASWPSAAGT
jgi:NADH-quinone oxidoreductase subunit M